MSDPSAPTGPPPESPRLTAELKTFLIADIRGYTRFTAERGDEAAGQLAARFAVVTQQAVEGHAGSVIELRGDEALAAFASPRQAIRAAIDLQDRYVEETRSDPSLPLTAGIGIDIGEAVAVEGGYRGAALNLAARLCVRAAAGEVLASREVVHLAGKLDSITYEDRGEVVFKGLANPVRVIRVASEAQDHRANLAPFAPQIVRRPRHRRRAQWVGLIVAAVAVVTGGLLLLVSGSGETPSFPTGPNTVALIDPSSNEAVDGVALGKGASPRAAAFGRGSLWVANLGSATITEIDPDTSSVERTISAGDAPSSIAVGEGLIWIATPISDKVRAFDPAASTIADVVTVPAATDVAVGFGWVWATDSSGNQLYRIDPGSRETFAIQVGQPGQDEEPKGVATGEAGVWVANSLGHSITHVDGETGRVVTPSIAVGPCAPEQVAVGAGHVWATCRHQNLVVKVDPRTDSLVDSIEVAAGPTGIAVANGAVWVTSGVAGTVQRIDPQRDGVVAKIQVPGNPQDVVVVDDRVWVAIAEKY